MDYIRGVTRNQVILFPETVEDYITEDNPVRFIDAFVEGLNLAEAGFARVQPKATGRRLAPAKLLSGNYDAAKACAGITDLTRAFEQHASA